MQDDTLLSPDERQQVIKDLLEKMRVLRLEWRRSEIEANQLLRSAEASTGTADSVLALSQARRLLQQANQSLVKYQAASKALSAFVVYGKLP
jgi:hypothetical protein